MFIKRNWCLIFVLFFSVLLCIKLQNIPQTAALPDSPPNTEAVIRVGFSQAERDNPWRTVQINSFREALIPNGMEFIYHEPEDYTAAWQAEDILSLVKEAVDYLVIAPADAFQLIPALKQAKEAGIPVILIGQDTGMIDASFYVSKISTDYKKEGEICAHLLEEKFQEKPCNIVEIYGPENSPAALTRSEGFHKEISRHDNLTVINVQFGNFNRITAQKAMETALIQASSQNQTIDAVFAHSDEDGLGALQAIKAAGINPKTISIVSINGIQDVYKAIIAGEYLGTIESNPKWGQIVDNLIDQMERGSKPFPVVIIPYRIINKENAATYFNTAY